MHVTWGTGKEKVPVMFHHLTYDLNNFLVDLLEMAKNPDDIHMICIY